MTFSAWLKSCWQGCRYCSRGLLWLVQWGFWMLLVFGAGVQVTILLSEYLRVPDFVLRQIESNLGAVGLQAEFGDVALDPRGRLLLRDVELSLAAVGTPIMRADSVYLEIDPWALWWREIDPQMVRFSGVNLLIPAALSPSGKAEALVEGIDATLRPTATRGMLALEHFTARIGAITVSMHGAIQLPDRASGPNEPWDHLLIKVSSHYLNACRQASRLLPYLAELDGLQLDLRLTPLKADFATVNLTAHASTVTLPLIPGQAERPTLHQATLRTDFALHRRPQTLPIDLRVGRIDGPKDITLDNLHALTELKYWSQPLSIEAGDLQLSVDRLTHPIAAVFGISARTNLQTFPLLQSEVTARFGGEPWQVISDLDITTGAGRIEVAGHVGSPVLDIAATQLGFDVPSVLQWDAPPYLTAAVNLGARAQPLRAEARFSTGAAEARGVPLSGTSARVRWQGTSLIADQILLRTGPSTATGSYEMDTESLDFRFLLRGQLEPYAIRGWFRDWWITLFEQFDFSGGLPQANVEVSGQWGAKLDTRIFISADATNPIVREIPMERMRTRLFTRPGWADVQHFLAERSMGEVEGAFARQWKMPDSRRWTRVEIHAGGVSDLSPAPKLLRRTGDALIAPFDFEEPLQIRVDGSATREDWGAPVTETFDIRGSTTGDWEFKGFPFVGANFNARREQDKILIDTFTARLADGEIDGRIELQGEGAAQRVAFDLDLAEASLGRTMHEVNTWLAVRRGEAPTDYTEFEQQMVDGRLTLSLSAEGPAKDLLGLQGSGSAAITDANFANINLLGVLSAMLDRTILNFTTLQLSHANADFVVNGPLVDFSRIKLTGKRGALSGSGNYSLADRSLDFTTKVRPFEGGEGLLDAVFTPFSSVLEVKLTGEFSDPEWTFVYGPTNLLRNLTGENTRSRTDLPTATETVRPENHASTPPETPSDSPPPPVEISVETDQE